MVEASVALDRCFKSERSAYANRVLDAVLNHGSVVPAIWLVEVVNGLLTGLRRGRIDEPEVAQAIEGR